MRRTALLVLLAVPLLASCSAQKSDSGAASARSVPFAAPQKAQAQAAPELARSVVRTASIDVHVKDTRSAADRAVAVAVGLGGRVDSDNRTQAGRGEAHLVLRVPPATVERALTQLAALGTELDRSVADKDVTSDTVDVRSRIATQQASVTRVRALLARAQSIADVTRVESELTSREAALESLQNRQKALAGQVDLASVTVTLTGSTVATPGSHATFADGLSGGWTALTGTARVLAVVAGALLPWSWLLVLVLGGRAAWRKWRPAAV
ncbi:MAG: hypothetical protein JWO22_1103 [Frankiales bacterium]|nr:hypothetical protein [Frankiales bacterium]